MLHDQYSDEKSAVSVLPLHEALDDEVLQDQYSEARASSGDARMVAEITERPTISRAQARLIAASPTVGPVSSGKHLPASEQCLWVDMPS